MRSEFSNSKRETKQGISSGVAYTSRGSAVCMGMANSRNGEIRVEETDK